MAGNKWGQTVPVCTEFEHTGVHQLNSILNSLLFVARLLKRE